MSKRRELAESRECETPQRSTTHGRQDVRRAGLSLPQRMLSRRRRHDPVRLRNRSTVSQCPNERRSGHVHFGEHNDAATFVFLYRKVLDEPMWCGGNRGDDNSQRNEFRLRRVLALQDRSISRDGQQTREQTKLDAPLFENLVSILREVFP